MQTNLQTIHTAIRTVLLVNVTLISLSLAAPYSGERMKLGQPDGAIITVMVFGDEYYHRIETPDGYTLLRDPQTGFNCYARLAPDSSSFISSSQVYSDGAIGPAHIEKHLRLKASAISAEIEKRRQDLCIAPVIRSTSILSSDASSPLPSAGTASLTSTGDIRGLTILVQFPDKDRTILKDSVERMINVPGYTGYGNNGSVYQYFYDVSGGRLRYTNYVANVYYTALHTWAYYNDPTAPFPSKARELAREAAAWLDGLGFDFRTLTTFQNAAKGNRTEVAAFNILYVDQPLLCLLPHKSDGAEFLSNDGVWTNVYAMANLGDIPTIRMMCHENGHMLMDWPDLYDIGQESAGLGSYCIMAQGGDSYNPVPPCAYLRIRAGWETVTECNGLAGTTQQITANSLSSFRFSHPTNPREFFLLESRQKTGQPTDRNEYLPDQGLMIWHIDASLSDTAANDREGVDRINHYKVRLVQADNATHLERNIDYGSEGDLYKGNAGGVTRFNDFTAPNARWWSSLYSTFAIQNISPVGPVMSFSFANTALAAAPSALETYVYKGRSVQNPIALANAGTDLLPWRVHRLDTGYACITWDQPDGPAYLWTDIATTGTELTKLTTPGQTPWQVITLQTFSFPYFETTTQSITVSHGYILIGGVEPKFSAEFPGRISAYTHAGLTNQTGGGPSIRFQEFNDKAIFQYTNLTSVTPGLSTFQIVLNRDGTILMYYKEMNCAEGNQTAEIAVGDLDKERTVYAKESNQNGSLLRNEFAIRFTPLKDTWRQRQSSMSGIIEAGGSNQITITSDATTLDPGLYLDDLVIRHQSPNLSETHVPLRMTVLDYAFTAMPAALDFGRVLVGSSVNRTTTLQNNTPTEVTITNISSSNTRYTFSGPAIPFTLPAWQTINLQITFQPTAVIVENGALMIQINSTPPLPSLTINLTGAGTPTNNLSANPASLSFGTVTSGQSASLNLSLVNNGDAPTTVSALSSDNIAFTFTPNPPITIAGNATQTVVVTFAPVASGSFNGILTIVNDADDHPTLSIPLSGTCSAPIGYHLKNGLSIGPSAINETRNAVYIVNDLRIGTATCGRISNSRYVLYLR
jgi:M6 family metalloprotease-like protein